MIWQNAIREIEMQRKETVFQKNNYKYLDLFDTYTQFRYY